MQLRILSLKGVEFDGQAQSFNVKTRVGEITVLNNHRPLITILESGTAKIGLPDGRIQEMKINSGFLEMDDKNNLNVLMS
jgi:F0F1-type ATP synthase epsilon subunit